MTRAAPAAALPAAAADTLSWRGHDVYDCTAEFRLFWGHSKLAELDQEGQQQQQQQQQCFLEPPGSAQGAGGEPAAPPAPPPWRRVAALPAYAATPGGLRAAHAAPAPFTRDGLCLLHRAAQYAPGLTPLALRWKDAASSAYVVETDPQGAVPPQQRVVLRYRMDRSVATGDEPPVPLATMPAAFAEAAGPDLRAGRLLRFRLGGGGVQLDATGRPVGACAAPAAVPAAPAHAVHDAAVQRALRGRVPARCMRLDD